MVEKVNVVHTIEGHRFHYRLEGVGKKDPTALLVYLIYDEPPEDGLVRYHGRMELHDGFSTKSQVNLEIKASSLSKLKEIAQTAAESFIREYFLMDGKIVVQNYRFEERR